MDHISEKDKEWFKNLETTQDKQWHDTLESVLEMSVSKLLNAKEMVIRFSKEGNSEHNEEWYENFFNDVIEKRTSLFWTEFGEKLEKTMNVNEKDEQDLDKCFQEFIDFLNYNITFFPFNSKEYKKLMQIKNKYNSLNKERELSHQKIAEAEEKIDRAMKGLVANLNNIDNLEQLESVKKIILDNKSIDNDDKLLLETIEKRKLEIENN